MDSLEKKFPSPSPKGRTGRGGGAGRKVVMNGIKKKKNEKKLRGRIFFILKQLNKLRQLKSRLMKKGKRATKGKCKGGKALSVFNVAQRTYNFNLLTLTNNLHILVRITNWITDKQQKKHTYINISYSIVFFLLLQPKRVNIGKKNRKKWSKISAGCIFLPLSTLNSANKERKYSSNEFVSCVLLIITCRYVHV
jgi:hypothetical protein